jgi:hypothetical protein
MRRIQRPAQPRERQVLVCSNVDDRQGKAVVCITSTSSMLPSFDDGRLSRCAAAGDSADGPSPRPCLQRRVQPSWWTLRNGGRPGPSESVRNRGTAQLHLLRISAARKSVVAVAGEATGLPRKRSHKSRLRCVARCPLCPDSDQVPQRSKMTRWAHI